SSDLSCFFFIYIIFNIEVFQFTSYMDIKFTVVESRDLIYTIHTVQCIFPCFFCCISDWRQRTNPRNYDSSLSHLSPPYSYPKLSKLHPRSDRRQSRPTRGYLLTLFYHFSAHDEY